MICRECGKDESAGEFKKHADSKNKGIHKKCHSKVERNKAKNLRASISPHKWMQCDDCDEIFNIMNQKRFLNTCCIYCKSEEIKTFAEIMGIK